MFVYSLIHIHCHSPQLDIHLAPAFFKWLRGDEQSLGLDDFEWLEPSVYRALRNLSAAAAASDDQFADLDVVRSFISRSVAELT